MNFIDLHCDTLLKLSDNFCSLTDNNGHITDIGLKKGKYLAQCFAIYTPPEITGESAYLYFNKNYKAYNKMINESEILKKVEYINEVKENSRCRKVSAILTIENAELLNCRLERISDIERLGTRILGMIHNRENCLGFPHTNEKSGLKQFGKDVVDALNYSNIIVDVSHLNYAGFFDVASISKVAFIATHSACRNLFNHTRNLYDNQIKYIADSGGVVGIPFYSYFLNGTPKTDIDDIINHLEHLINIGGEAVASIGTDFDGMECELFLKNCSEIQILADKIIKKFGFNIAEKICYKNALRVLG